MHSHPDIMYVGVKDDQGVKYNMFRFLTCDLDKSSKRISLQNYIIDDLTAYWWVLVLNLIFGKHGWYSVQNGRNASSMKPNKFYHMYNESWSCHFAYGGNKACQNTHTHTERVTLTLVFGCTWPSPGCPRLWCRRWRRWRPNWSCSGLTPRCWGDRPGTLSPDPSPDSTP